MSSKTVGVPSDNSNNNAAAAAQQSKNSTLVAAAFHTSLDNLLLEATRHRTMSPLRDAVQSTRLRGFAAEDIFHTFVLACDILHARRQYRLLLLQSISDLGKIASLRLLPITGNVLHIICHLVRKLLGTGTGTITTGSSISGAGSSHLIHRGLQASTLRGAEGHAASSLLEGTLGVDGDIYEVSLSYTNLPAGNVGGSLYNEVSETLPLLDEEMRMRILQMLMAYLSACALGNTALADMLGILFTIYLQSAEGSMVEATCAATIEQRTLAVLCSLRSHGNNITNTNTSSNIQVEDDNASLCVQMQSVAYVKDLCNICAGSLPKWLKLGSYRSGSTVIATPNSNSEPSVALPRRLRILLLQTLITHFTESEPITSAQQLSIFFVQCINEDVVALVLGRGKNNRGSEQYELIKQRQGGEKGENLVDLFSSLDDHSDEEEFYLKQKLAVTVLTRALPVMRHTMPTLLRHHVMLVKLCSEGDVSGEEARCMAIILTLWRKAIADHRLLRQLLLLTPPSNGGDFGLHNSILFAPTPPVPRTQQPREEGEEEEEEELQTSSADEFYPMRTTVISPNLSAEMDAIPLEDMDGTRPFADLVTASAQLLACIIAASEGIVDLDAVGRRKEMKRTTSTQNSCGAREFLRPLQLSMTIAHLSQPQASTSSSPQQPLHHDTTSPPFLDKMSPYDLEESHPATRQTNDVLAFLTMFTQSFSSIVEEISVSERTPTRGVRNSTTTTTAANDSQKEATSLFLSLHPPLLRSFALATQHLQGDDVIHTILKGCTHLLKVSCALGLPVQRDGYLHIFLSSLHLEKDPQPQQSLDGIDMLQRRKNPSSDERFLSQGGGKFPGGTSSRLKPDDVVRGSLNGLQQKLYVLNCVISIANSMGAVLGEGWRPVASCLLAVEPLLQEVNGGVGQQLQPPPPTQQQQQQGTIEEFTLQDVVCNANHVRDALHLLFINTALSTDPKALEGLLVHFVGEACGTQNGDTNNRGSGGHTHNARSHKGDSLLSLRMAGECCALALLAAAGRREVPLPLQRLLRLWAAVRPLYRHALLNPQNYCYYDHRSHHHTQHRDVELLLQTMEVLVEDVAVVAAQFCRRVNRSSGGQNNNNNNNNNHTTTSHKSNRDTNSGSDGVGIKGRDEMAVSQLGVGPYSTAAVVLRFMSLCPMPVQTYRDVALTRGPQSLAGNLNDEKSESGMKESEELKQQLLALPLELLATVFDHMQELPQGQQRQEEEEKDSTGDDDDGGGGGGGGNSEVLQTIARGVSLALLKEVLKLVQGFGEELRGPAWVHLLQLLRCTALLPQPNTLVAPVVTNMTPRPQPTHAGETVTGKQGIGIAFRALETIQHSCITNLDAEGLRQLIRCGGAFMTHSLASTEQRLNINLSAVQLLWSIADYVVSREKDGEKNDDILWCTLFMQLYDGCLDVRPEVRQSALKTLFSLVQAYGGRFSGDCWRCVLRSVFASLMDITMQAISACTIPPRSLPPTTTNTTTTTNATPIITPPAVLTTACNRSGSAGEEEHLPQRSGYVALSSGRDSLRPQHRRCGSSASASTLFGDAMHILQRYDGEEEMRIAKLLTHLSEHPAFFDDMRVTIMDAVCRVFVSHHRAMHTALIMQKAESQQRLESEALLHDVISLFIEVCAGVRMVARTTNGEAAALSAVRALHALMAATDITLLTEAELEAAWFAVEQLVRRDRDCRHTARKQCTAAVVSVVVTSLGDVVSMRLMGLQKLRQQEQQSVGVVLPSANTAVSSASSSTSFFDQLRYAFTPASARFRRRSSSVSGGNNGKPRHSYFSEYHRLIQESLRSPAVTDSYFFPSRVQTAVIGAWKMLWPLLSGSEQNSVVDLILQQFPSRHALQAFVTQHVTFSGGEGLLEEYKSGTVEHCTKQSQQKRRGQPVTLQESVPAGAHPNFLLVLMDFLILIASDSSLCGGEEERGNEEQQQQHSELVMRMAPTVIRLAGVLLLLEYAPLEVLATPGPGAPFHLSSDFFERAEHCLRFFLLVVLWDMPRGSMPGAQTPSTMPTANINRSKVTAALFTSSRREGLLAFATTFATLVSLASTMLNNVESRKSPTLTVSDLPLHLQHALQRLQGLVILLSKLIPHVIRSSGEVNVATELLSVLVPSSSVESPLFAGVAGCSLDVLRRWSVPSSSLSSHTPLSALGRSLVYENVVLPDEHEAEVQTMGRLTDGGDSLETSLRKETVHAPHQSEDVSSMLLSVARASMGARNRAVLKRFLLNNKNPEARQMAKTTLQTLVLLYPTVVQEERRRPPPSSSSSSTTTTTTTRRSMSPSEKWETGAAADSHDNDKDEDENTETLQGILLELARLVEYTGNDAEFSSLLSRAILGVCAALGFSHTASS